MEHSRVELLPITFEDTERIIAWRNTSNVRSQFVYQKPFTAEGHEKWMKTRVETGEVVQFIIRIKENHELIGSVYLRDIDKENKSAELGIFIGEPTALEKGYGTEATRQIVQYGFCELGLHRVFLRVFADNQRAISCYKKAGLIEEGIAKDMILQNGQYKDMMFMSIIHSERRE